MRTKTKTDKNTQSQRLEVITPKLAEQYLLANQNPRPLRESHVEGFIRKLEKGEFETTHQGILFTDTGALKDGQHRLTAIQRSGISASMWVCRGCTDEQVLAVDRGEARSNAVVLGIDQREATVITYAVKLASEGRRGKALTSDLLLMKRGIGEDVHRLIMACGTCKRVLSSAPVKLGAVAVMLGGSKEQEDYAMAAYRALVLGEFDAMTPVVQALYRRLVQSDRSFSADMALATSYRAFQLKNRANAKTQVNDLSGTLREIADKLIEACVK